MSREADQARSSSPISWMTPNLVKRLEEGGPQREGKNCLHGTSMRLHAPHPGLGMRCALRLGTLLIFKILWHHLLQEAPLIASQHSITWLSEQKSNGVQKSPGPGAKVPWAPLLILPLKI